MKKIAVGALLLLSTFSMVNAQTKIKETAVPRSVILSLEKTYDSYKVKTWYQAPGQYIAEVLIDGQEGRSYFTAGGDWQYSSFPVKMEESPTMMTSYFTDNYPGYRVKTLDYIEEMSGDNYYRMMITKKGISETDYEMVFDTRGKLMKSNAPDPDAVKRDYYTSPRPPRLRRAVTVAVLPPRRTNLRCCSSPPVRPLSTTSIRRWARNAARQVPNGSTATTNTLWLTSPTNRKWRKRLSTSSSRASLS